MKTNTWIARPLAQWIVYPPNCCWLRSIRQRRNVPNSELGVAHTCPQPSRSDRAFSTRLLTCLTVTNYLIINANHLIITYQSPVTNRRNLQPTPVISYPSAVNTFLSTCVSTKPPTSKQPRRPEREQSRLAELGIVQRSHLIPAGMNVHSIERPGVPVIQNALPSQPPSEPKADSITQCAAALAA